MQKESLVVQNFFTLKDIDIDLAKFNVFIGEQASGKSLLVKLIYFFRNTILLPIINYRTSSIDLKVMFVSLLTRILNLNISNHGANSEIIYKIGAYSIKLIIANENITIEWSENITLLYSEKRNELLKQYTEIGENIDLSDMVRYALMEVQVSNAINSINFGANSLKRFLPAGRMSLLSVGYNLFGMIQDSNENVNLNPLIIQFGQDYQNAISKFSNVSGLEEIEKLSLFEARSENILKGKYVNDAVNGFIQQSGFQTRLLHGSSGQQEFLPVYIILRDYLLSKQSGSGYLFIEEPEAHLYPTAQKSIVELLVYVTNVTNSSGLYITTHSPYVLAVLDNLITAYDVRDKQTEFDANLLIPFEDVSAYFIKDGLAHDLRDVENRIIVAEELDSVSEQNAMEFDHLLDLKYE